MKIKKLKNRKIIIPALLIILVLLALLTLEKLNITNLYEKKPELKPSDPESSLNLYPPSDDEKNETEKAKKERYDRDQARKSSTPTSNVVPLITYAGQYNGKIESSGFVNGIFEEGGQCHFVFKQNQSVITGDTVGVKNVSNTSCPAVRLDQSQFAKGAWSVTLEYKSSVSNGTSVPITFEVK